jgi:uncharacterized protein with HEPN domain
MPSQSSRQAEWCGQIIDQIDRIFSYLGTPLDITRFDDALTADAIERCLERISEAVARRHRAEIDLNALEPSIDWRSIRSFGNRLRHEYDTLDADVIASTISHLPELRLAALRLAQAL